MCAAIRSACDVRLDGLDVLGANRLFLQCSDKAVCQLRREEVHEEEGVVEGPLCAEDESAGEKRGLGDGHESAACHQRTSSC